MALDDVAALGLLPSMPNFFYLLLFDSAFRKECVSDAPSGWRACQPRPNPCLENAPTNANGGWTLGFVSVDVFDGGCNRGASESQLG